MVQQVDHGLAAIAQFAVAVLVEMQRQRARVIEQRDVTRLRVHQVGAAQIRHERRERAPLGLGQRAFGLENGRHLVQAVDQLLLGVDEQRGQHLERQHDARSVCRFTTRARRASCACPARTG